ncbi:MAG: radical SAM protein [Desulfobacteraceae bacterium]|nr:radical SAM protein [Desulfobacteraceae bacterium]
MEPLKKEPAGEQVESPQFLKMSLAAAMTLGFKPGLFYRNARLHCINLLLTYDNGCAANCSYCGLSNPEAGQSEAKTFIRVTWPGYPVHDIIRQITAKKDQVKRICISMITNKRAIEDTETICWLLRRATDIPISLLVAPTILNYDHLTSFKQAGADKIGVAIDLATRELFMKFRGGGKGKPHEWERYWQCLKEAIEVFGQGMAGAHFITGMGETEKEMSQALQKTHDMGGTIHLFSFFPEPHTDMADWPMPPMDQYRRIQIARHVMDSGLSHEREFLYDAGGRILDFGLSQTQLDEIIDSGEPFRTSGCTGDDGQVACNRPFGNSRPGPDMRNYPFAPNTDDLKRIRKQLFF